MGQPKHFPQGKPVFVLMKLLDFETKEKDLNACYHPTRLWVLLVESYTKGLRKMGFFLLEIKTKQQLSLKSIFGTKQRLCFVYEVSKNLKSKVKVLRTISYEDIGL